MTVDSASNDIFVIQISDPHLFASSEQKLRGVNTDHTLRRVLQQIQAEENLDLLLLTGDLVQDETREGYTRLKTYLDDLGLPSFALPGNHDNPDFLEQVLTDARSQVGGHTTVGNWCLVLLSSYLEGSAGGRLSQAELDRLSELLDRYADKHFLVALHHHPISMNSAWLDTVGLENRDDLWDILNGHSNVRGVVWGHVHQSLEATRNNVLLLATPSTCAQFKPEVDEFAIDDKPPAYRRLRLRSSGEISTEIIWIED